MFVYVVIILGLILRLALSPLYFHVDLLSFAGWGQWIYTHGPLGFYENGIWIYSWPTQPPFVNLIYGFNNYLYIFLLQTFRDIGNVIVEYHIAPGHLRFWFEFTKRFDVGKISDESVFTTGYLISIKILPILADLGIAGLIYYLAKTLNKFKHPEIWPFIYLISPFSWYLSSLWGQYDQLSFLPLLAAFILESRKKIPWLTPFLFAFSVAIKPTSLILLPFFIFVYLKNSHRKTYLFISIALTVIFFLITTNVFTNENLISFTETTLVTKIFLKSSSRLSVNSFNFWRILQTNFNGSHDTRFLFIPAYIWSTLAYIFLNLWTFKKTVKMNAENIFLGAFVISAGSWLFMTDMLERYFFIGVVMGLIVCIYNPKIFKYWILMSLIFWLNLYHGWWYPPMFEPLQMVVAWQNGFMTKIFSGINVFLFFRLLSKIHFAGEEKRAPTREAER